MVSHTINNVDVLTITNDEKVAFINYIHVSNGSINQSFTFEYKKKLDETDEELLQLGIVEMRERFHSNAKEIILPQEIDVNLEGVDFANGNVVLQEPVVMEPDALTGVESMNAGKAVAGVKYYNVAGQASDKAFKGVNIVVTTYTDGTTRTVKVVK